MRIAVFATHPIQYHVPLWRTLSDRSGVDLRVFFGSNISVRGYEDRDFGVNVRWDVPLAAGYSCAFLTGSWKIKRVNVWQPSGRGIARAIRDFRPHAGILTAYGSRFHLAAFAGLWKKKVPIVLRHEATDMAVARSQLKARLRDWFLHQFYSRISAFGAIGSQARRHLIRLGVRPERIFFSPYCVDTGFIAQQVARWLPRRSEIRRGMGIGDDDLAFAFCGKLIPKKDPLLILTAFELLVREGCDLDGRIHLVVAGDGELRQEIERMGSRLMGRRLHVLGFLNQTEIGKAYTAADCLILPSRRGAGETWGLVVNEAMQFGLPAIVSDGVGCHSDLIVSGETGQVFPSGDAAALAAAVKSFVELPLRERVRLADLSRAHVRRFSIEGAAAGLVDALSAACRSKGA